MNLICLRNDTHFPAELIVKEFALFPDLSEQFVVMLQTLDLMSYSGGLTVLYTFT